MLNSYIAVLPVVLSIGVSVHAWGTLGHETVANVALQYLQPATLDAVNWILYNDSIVSVATWADSYRYTTAGAFSAPWHYVDANDNPPDACNIDYERDCIGTGCVISAIGNYTYRIQQSILSNADQAQSLKFLVHFLGDITQPLHDEALEVGGNDIDVLWQGKANNLHHIWDTEMITQLAGSATTADLNAWTATITSGINNGQYTSSVATWISCITPSAISSIDAAEDCATTWAVDANAFVCSYVLATDPTGQECSGTYYNGASSIIQLQIAKVRPAVTLFNPEMLIVILVYAFKGGVRLAAWLNMIYTGETGF
ncbi:hypothetical protein FRB97_008784 [Tulasnella sp. 331]|nr:hypothetical protein FRB97_008784 [Tulasnella sp. 331]